MQRQLTNRIGSKKAHSSLASTVLLRKQRGQAIAEGTAMLCLLIPLAMFFVCALVNIFALATYSTKLSLVATEAVKYRAENLYWLGMKRPNADPVLADTQASSLAIALAKDAGIDLTARDVQFSQVTLTGTSQTFPAVQCTVTSRTFNLPFAGVLGLPLVMAPSAKVTIPAVPVPPPAVVCLDAHYVTGGSDQQQAQSAASGSQSNAGLYVPCYGGQYQTQWQGPTSQIEPGDVPEPGELSTQCVLGVMDVGYLRSPSLTNPSVSSSAGN